MTEKSPHQVPGMFSLVLHTHLPWLANHGRWPVGEEWLYQSWASCYLPVTALLKKLSAEGKKNLITLGITPVVAAQLDDPHCLDGMHHWLGNWQLRACEAATIGPTDAKPGTASEQNALRHFGSHEYSISTAALRDFELQWAHGGSPVLRGLIDSEAIELLGGPLAHPFQPLLHPRLREYALMEGLADSQLRFGSTPTGIWAPECAYAPGMEHGYHKAGVTHFMVDGPSLHGDTALGRPVGQSPVTAFGRDLTVSYRVWSPKSGYPGHGSYRDFHTYDHNTGLKPARVTGRGIDSPDKAPYDPGAAAHTVDRHVADFVATVRQRLIDESNRIGRGAHVIAAFDTELFGHWWHEGPQWLDKVLRALPEAGVTVGTLAQARSAGFIGAPVDLPASSWGSGKDWRVWAGEQVNDLVQLNHEVVETALNCVDKSAPDSPPLRNRVNDQVLREALLAVSSDWPFMVSKESAATYARNRAHTHAHAMREIAAAAMSGKDTVAQRLSDGWNHADNLFGSLDARRLPAIAEEDPATTSEQENS